VEFTFGKLELRCAPHEVPVMGRRADYEPSASRVGLVVRAALSSEYHGDGTGYQAVNRALNFPAGAAIALEAGLDIVIVRTIEGRKVLFRRPSRRPLVQWGLRRGGVLVLHGASTIWIADCVSATCRYCRLKPSIDWVGFRRIGSHGTDPRHGVAPFSRQELVSSSQEYEGD
jgi:hypothetical protein